MNEAQKAILAQKRQRLQQQLAVDSNITNHIRYWLPVFDVVLQHNIPYELEYLYCMGAAEKEFWEAGLNTPPLKGYPFTPEHLKISAHFYIHSQMQQAYPGVLPLRYLPGISPAVYSNDAAFMLQKVIAEMSLPDQAVYFFYNRYAPVLQLSLYHICTNAAALYDWPDDVSVIATDFSWIIYRSMEDEWVWGIKKCNGSQ